MPRVPRVPRQLMVDFARMDTEKLDKILAVLVGAEMEARVKKPQRRVTAP
jgi:hypothetical protein